MARGWMALGRIVAPGCITLLACAACQSLLDFSGAVPSPSEDADVTAPPPDAAVEFVCDSGATFCDDFDVDPLGHRWDALRVHSDAATLALVPSDASPPYALFANLTTAGDPAYAYLVKRFTGPLATLECSFDMQVEATSAGTKAGHMDVFAIDVTSEMHESLYLLQFGFRDDDNVGGRDGGSIREDIVYPTGEEALPAKESQAFLETPRGEWVRVTIATDLRERISIKYGDDDVLVDAPLRGVPAQMDVVSLHVGLRSYNRHDVSAWIDNLSCTVTR